MPRTGHLGKEWDGKHNGEGNGNDYGTFNKAGTRAGHKKGGIADDGHRVRTNDTGDRHQDETRAKNKSLKGVTGPLRRLLNKYKEGEGSYQALRRMMDSRRYPAPCDPNRKRHLTGGTKDKANTQHNSTHQAKTKSKEEEKGNKVEPVYNTQNIASSEAKT